MKPLGKIGNLQDLDLRDGDFVVCVDASDGGGLFRAGGVSKIEVSPVTLFPAAKIGGNYSSNNRATFQRLHHHDPRCFGFEENTHGGDAVEIFKVHDDGDVIGSIGGSDHEDWNTDGKWWYKTTRKSSYDLIPLTPQAEFEVLGQRFKTRKEAEDAIEIKEVTG